MTKTYLEIKDYHNHFYYFKKDKYHDLQSINDKPSLFSFLKKKQWLEKGWHKDNLLHRTKGPAIFFINQQHEYWLYGENYDREEWIEEKDFIMK